MEKAIVEQAYRYRMPVPDKIKNAPMLYAGLDLFYIAFMDLTTCRQLGYGTVGPIDWLTIHHYCAVYGLVGEQREDMFFFISQMDGEFLKWASKKKPAEPPPSGRTGGRR